MRCPRWIVPLDNVRKPSMRRIWCIGEICKLRSRARSKSCEMSKRGVSLSESLKRYTASGTKLCQDVLKCDRNSLYGLTVETKRRSRSRIGHERSIQPIVFTWGVWHMCDEYFRMNKLIDIHFVIWTRLSAAFSKVRSVWGQMGLKYPFRILDRWCIFFFSSQKYSVVTCAFVRNLGVP